MKQIILHGALKQFSEEPLLLDVTSPAETMQALKSIFGVKFQRMINAGKFWLIRGNINDLDKVDYVEPNELLFDKQEDVFHIIPYVEGSGGQGFNIGKIIIGIVLIVASFYCGGCAAYPYLVSTMLATGISLALSGIAGVFAGSPKTGDQHNADRPDQRPSAIFNGVTNVQQQGVPVPLAVGTSLVGSIIVSTGASVEIETFTPPPKPPSETPPSSPPPSDNVPEETYYGGGDDDGD